MITYKTHILKLTFIILLTFSVTSNVFGQELTLVDNKGTLKTVINNTVTTGAAPSNPLANDIWFDTTTNPNESTLKIWDATTSVWRDFSNIYNTNGTLTADRIVTMEDKELVFLSDQSSKSTLTLRRNDNLQEVGIAFRNTVANYEAAIVMGVDTGTGANLDFYSGGLNADVDLLVATLSLRDDNQIQFSQYGKTTALFDNTSPVYILGVDADGLVGEVVPNTIGTDDQNSSEVDLSTPLDINGDATNETTVQEALEVLRDLTLIGTPGSVFFADTDGTTTEDNPNLYWDDANNRLYIGDRTLSGSNVLNVDGTTRTSGLNNSPGTPGQPSYRFSSDSDTGMYRPAANNLHFATGGIEAVSIAADQNVTIHSLEPGTITDEVVVADANGLLKKAPISSLIPTIYVTGRHTDGGIATELGYAATLTRTGKGLYSIVFDTDIGTTNYTIQLTTEACDQGTTCPNRQPKVMYTNIASTGFDILAGDGDNNSGDISPQDIGFMYTVIKLP